LKKSACLRRPYFATGWVGTSAGCETSVPGARCESAKKNQVSGLVIEVECIISPKTVLACFMYYTPSNSLGRSSLHVTMLIKFNKT